jgi:putative ABC transport system permease protein
MLKYNLIFAIRHILRNKTYSLITLLGMTIGLSCAILLFLDVLYNLNYDRFHKNYNRIYTINSWMPDAKDKGYMSDAYSALIGPLLKDQVPEIEDYTRIDNEQYIIKAADKTFSEKGIYADNNFFNIFSFPLIEGEQQRVLMDNNFIVISERMADKFFGTVSCIGKILTIKTSNSLKSFQISGVIKDLPQQSTVNFDFIIPFSKYLADNKWADSFSSTSTSIWILMRKGGEKEKIISKINEVINSHDPIKGKKHILISLKEKHLYNFFFGKRSIVGFILDVIIFSAVGIIIFILACFNFMNLAIAWIMKRSGEAGIKKSLGSNRRGIIFQFLAESMILSLISLVFSLIIVAFLLPFYNTLSPVDRVLTIPFSNFTIMFSFILMALIAGFLSTLYPAVLLSSVKLINILKKNNSLNIGMNNFRQGLIIFQFFISVVFITLSFVVWRQAEYLKTKDLGINKDNILFFNNHDNIRKHQTTFKNELISVKEVSSVCYSNSRPFSGVQSSAKVDWSEKDQTQNQYFELINTDFDFQKTLQPILLKGRFFEEGLATDSDNYIINETAQELINVKEPVGKTISVNGHKGIIIGIVKNFHTHSLFLAHLPLIIKIDPLKANYTIVKFSSLNKEALIENLKNKYKKFESDFPFEPEFANDLYNKQNNRDPAAILTGIFACIAIFLACFGLYGLSSFLIEKRTKEIGIRKINGATIFQIVILLLHSYIKWIFIAVLIALPVAFILSRGFLGIFAFRAEMPYLAFIAGPLIVLCLAVLTVIWKTVRAATRNPVEALRYE